MEDINRKNNTNEYFEDIFQTYSDVIFRLCFYKTSNHDVAHDLTQETFLRLWKSISAEKEIEKPKQYIYQIARNLIIDYYKTRKALSLDSMVDEGFSPKSEGISSETLSEINLLRDRIETLDLEFRDVIYMKFVEGMRVKEIAEIIGISENLASVRISRGKQKLREQFD